MEGEASVTRTVLNHSIVEGQYLKGWLRLQNVRARRIPLRCFSPYGPSPSLSRLYTRSRSEKFDQKSINWINIASYSIIARVLLIFLEEKFSLELYKDEENDTYEYDTRTTFELNNNNKISEEKL